MGRRTPTTDCRRKPAARAAAGACLLLAALWAAGCAPAPLPGSGLQLSEAPAGTVLGRYRWERPDGHWRLPDQLEEISGLTHADERLLAHHDNNSTLWLLTAGDPPRRLGGQRGAAAPLDGDFEGVTRLGDSVYLLGSQGRLLRAPLEPAAGALAGGLTAVPSGLEGRCNFEGLTARAAAGTLYVACKYPRMPAAGEILLFVLTPGSAEPPRPLRVDVTAILSRTRFSRLRPSGLTWVDGDDRLLVLAGKERVILELDAAAKLVAWRRLPRRYHRQAEGLSISPAGAILIADEADGRRATLSMYNPAPASVPGIQTPR